LLDQVAILDQLADEWIDLVKGHLRCRKTFQITARESISGTRNSSAAAQASSQAATPYFCTMFSMPWMRRTLSSGWRSYIASESVPMFRPAL
jgi:hypothetical protein